MRIPGVKTAKAFSRCARARILGGALILGYHRVANVAHDEYEVCIAPDHFTEQMEVVSRYLHPISLSKLVQYLKAGSLPTKTVAVTFDDGYVDNLYQAKPVLEKFDVPATVFVCTGYLGREFWWDELERLIMSLQSPLHALHLQQGENRFLWNQPNLSVGVQDPGDRRQFHHALYHFLLPLDKADQNHALNKIRKWSGISSDEKPTARAMDHQELLQLVDGGLIELGLHTRNHLMLPLLSREQQRDEIISGRQEIEALSGKRIEGFAYPNGKMTIEAKTILQEEGFQYSCSSEVNLFRPGCDIYNLPRFWPKDLDGENFMQYLRRWISL